MTRVLVDGKPSVLGQKIGKGGEGEVFKLEGSEGVAIKIYTSSPAEMPSRRDKVRAMLREKYASRTALVAFPTAEVTDLDGRFLGFAMRLVRDHKPLHELYAPGERKANFPSADFRFLVRAASNIARAVAAVHQTGSVIGDINHSCFLISTQATASMIDADSFQISTPIGEHLCKVGVPEYTPPELQGRSLVGVRRTANHDAFGLAVVIFQLLFMGRHPFVGSVRTGEVPPIHESIGAFRYVYTDTRNVGMDQPPGTPSVSDFSPHVAATFERAFSREGIRQRPQAQEWAAVLDALELTLVKCDENPLHYIPRDASDCAWCEMERQVGVALFVVHVPAAQLVQGHDPGAQRFPLDDLWRRITQIHAATGTQFTPKFQALQVAPSSEAKRAKRQLGSSPWGAYGVMLAAVAGFMAVPKAFFLWVIVFFGGVFMSQSRKSLDGTPFRSAFTACDQLYARELLNWQRRNGVDDFLRLFTELENAKSEYELLAREETRQTSRYCEDRRNHQLQAFLDTFPIARASIRGIGAARRAVLASYGVDTAADVTRAKILSLPGFGESVARPLLDWRQKLEARFVYQPNSTAADHAAIAKIRTQIQARAAPLRQKLSAGPQNLTALAARFQQIASREDDILNRARRNLEQTRADLVYLGLAVPASAPAAPGPSRATSTPAPSVAAPMPRASGPSPASGVQCPRCGSGMTKRLARRGRNAGGYFWGCNRYPACKGTRNI